MPVTELTPQQVSQGIVEMKEMLVQHVLQTGKSFRRTDIYRTFSAEFAQRGLYRDEKNEVWSRLGDDPQVVTSFRKAKGASRGSDHIRPAHNARARAISTLAPAPRARIDGNGVAEVDVENDWIGEEKVVIPAITYGDQAYQVVYTDGSVLVASSV